MPDALMILLIVFLPLLNFILLGLFGKKIFGRYTAVFSSFLILISSVLSIMVAAGYFFDHGQVAGVYQRLVPFSMHWLDFSNGLSINMGVILDPISAMMMVVVSFISLMVHVYSLSYMKGEERLSTYFAFLGLFTFSMLGLVVASNIFQMYFFWELVGLSSFLLIGFYYDKPAAVAACKKAFIVTRFADLGFLVGILVLSYNSGTLDFVSMIERLTDSNSPAFQRSIAGSFLGMSALSWGLVLVFIGGAGKSAMFPFHIWLPDAMEGPTPVSALIHAATMVVAGVFLVARLFPVYAFAPGAVLQLIASVGIFSALFAAIIACTQTDIKRVLAFSTMSQIGFMMFALGVSGYGGEEGLGYTASLFHLFTHAMFKALLFLGAGAIIHYVHSNDMNEMGGLRKKMPVTHITFLIACLAISGVPPFAGFFSKEEILLAAWQHNKMIYWLALLTSGLTAFYMFRLYFSIFWKKSAAISHDHQEGSWLMKIPLLILSLGAAVGGFIPFGKYVSTDGKPLLSELHLQFSMAPVLLAIAAIAFAMYLYKSENSRPERISASLGKLYTGARQKFYVDEVYLFITKKIVFGLVGKPIAWIDKNIVDGTVNFVGSSTKRVSEKIKGLQSGSVQLYGVYFLGGIIGLVVLFTYFLHA